MIKTVNAGQSIQSAVDTALDGDVIKVEAGATFRGPVELPAKIGSTGVVIQSSRADELPQVRMSLVDSALMPKILVPHAEQAIRTMPGAHHYKFDGIAVLPDAGATILYDLVRFGGSRDEQKTLASVPHHLKMDRCVVGGLPTSNFRSGLSLNSSDTEVTRCYFSEIHAIGDDSQAIISYNTPGRNKVIDCYLEAAGENFMLGGSDSFSSEFIPSDYEIRQCHMFKPLSWRTSNARWTVKNWFEIKSGRRILVDGCVMENNWGGQRPDGSDWGQDGTGVLFTVRNQDCHAPWSTVEDVEFKNTTLRNAFGGAFNFLGMDNEVTAEFGKCNPPSASGRGQRVRVSNCLVYDIFGPFLSLNGFFDVTLDHITHLQRGNFMVFNGEPSTGFRYVKNLTQDHDYGIRDASGIDGIPALVKWVPGCDMTANVVAKPYTAYPSGNQYPPSLSLPEDFRSPFNDVGCDIDALRAAQSGTVTPPIPLPTPTPTPTPTPIPTPTEVVISGKITKKDGSPLSGVRVMINPGNDIKATKGDGKFSFKMKPGNYTIIAGASNSWWVYQPCYRSIKVTQNTSNVDFVAIASNDPSLFT